MSWEQIEARIRENDEDPKIGFNPVRTEVVAALRQDPRVAPDEVTGQDKKMIFVRVGGRDGALLGVQISNTKSVGFWCEAQYMESLKSSGFDVKYKICERKPGSANTGRHSALDRPNRFDDVPLIYTEVSGAAAATKVIGVVSPSHFDWGRFWTGFLHEAGLPVSLSRPQSTIELAIDIGIRMQLSGRAPGRGISVTLVFDGDRSEARYLRLLSLCGSIEERLGAKLNWNGKDPALDRFSVAYSIAAPDISEQGQWPDAYKLFRSATEKLRSTVSDIARLEGA